MRASALVCAVGTRVATDIDSLGCTSERADMTVATALAYAAPIPTMVMRTKVESKVCASDLPVRGRVSEVRNHHLRASCVTR